MPVVLGEGESGGVAERIGGHGRVGAQVPHLGVALGGKGLAVRGPPPTRGPLPPVVGRCAGGDMEGCSVGARGRLWGGARGKVGLAVGGGGGGGAGGGGGVSGGGFGGPLLVQRNVADVNGQHQGDLWRLDIDLKPHRLDLILT